MNPKDVLQIGQQALDVLSRKFQGKVLGYVTPWNRGGLDLAMRWRVKFSHISPVWLQLKGDKLGIRVEGLHEVNKTWIKAMRKLPRGAKSRGLSAPKIVPRLAFEVSPQNAFEVLTTESDETIRSIVRMCEKRGFDGVVLEAWSQWVAMQLTSVPAAREAALDFVRRLATALGASTTRKGQPKELLFVIPPAPSAPGNAPRASSAFAWPELQEFHELLGGVSLMTYDYSAGTGGPQPNAPLKWVEDCLGSLLPPGDAALAAAPKVLMGLNFYGRLFTPKEMRPIVAHELSDLLEEGGSSVKVRWSVEHEEHEFEFSKNGERHVAYFPTLKSIQVRLDEARRWGAGVSIWELGQGFDSFFDLL